MRAACVLLLPVAAEHLLDVVVFEFAEGDQLAAGGRDIES